MKIHDRIEHLATNLFQDNEELKKSFCASLRDQKSARPISILVNSEKLQKGYALKNIDALLNLIPEEWNYYWTLRESTSEQDLLPDVYSLDCSSIFMLSPLIELKLANEQIRLICDACAAPGGKAILAYQLFKPELLIALEKSPERIKALISNFSKLKIKNAAIGLTDSRQFAKNSAQFDLVIVDAPCTGQSMYARGVNNESAFTRLAIDRASNSQKGIINSLSKLVKPKQYLLYSTCTYSKDENEKVIEWFLRKNPSFRSVKVSHLETFRSSYSKEYAYRLWPNQGLGAGGFTCLLQNNVFYEEEEPKQSNLKSQRFIWQSFEKKINDE